MACQSKPHENEQFYTDPATGQKTSCSYICVERTVRTLCDAYCKGYCETTGSTTEVSAPTSTAVSEEGLPKDVIVLISVVIILIILLILCLIICFRKRCYSVLRRLKRRRNNSSQQKTPRSDSKIEILDKTKTESSPQTINKNGKQRQRDQQRQKTRPESKNLPAEDWTLLLGGDKTQQTQEQNTTVGATYIKNVSSQGQKETSIDTGLGGMSYNSHSKSGNDNPIGKTCTKAVTTPVIKDTVEDNSNVTAEQASFMRTERGKEVSCPSHSYTEHNKPVTSPTDDHNSSFQPSSHELPHRSHGSTLVSAQPDTSGMDGEVAQEYLQHTCSGQYTM